MIISLAALHKHLTDDLSMRRPGRLYGGTAEAAGHVARRAAAADPNRKSDASTSQKYAASQKHILCDTSRMPLLSHSLPIILFLVASPEHH